MYTRYVRIKTESPAGTGRGQGKLQVFRNTSGSFEQNKQYIGLASLGDNHNIPHKHYLFVTKNKSKAPAPNEARAF